MSLCLNMIVKDESHVIRRCLESVRPLIDTWVIVDTGSTDGTQDLIREIFADLPGQLHERPWKDFGSNRSEAIQLAAGAADYLLFLDADDTLVVPDGYKLPELTGDAYDIEFLHGAISYRRTCVVNTALPWRFEGVLHEYPTCDQAVTIEHLDLAIRYGGDGARSTQDQVAKYTADALVLEAALAENPDHPRNVFYLAQSYKDSQQLEKSLEAYGRRATMAGFDQEVYWSKLTASRLARILGHPEAEIIDRYLRAYDERPSRVEALGDLAEYCRQTKRWASGLMFAERGLAQAPSDDVLFVEPAWHAYKLLDERAIALYWLGRYAESLAACDELLDSGRLPHEHRDRVRANKKFAEEKLGR